MSGRGRPLRFLAMVAVGWIGVRVAMLWPTTGSLPAAIRAAVPIAATAPIPARLVRPTLPARAPGVALAGFVPPLVRAAVVAALPPADRAVDSARVQAALLNLLLFGDPECADVVPIGFTRGRSAAVQSQPFEPVASGWSASAWAVVRPGSGLGAAPGGQLGGSQAGARAAYVVDGRRRIALFGRIATPLRGPGREAAIGLEWQPTRLPVRLVAEQRLTLDDGRPGTGLGVVAGTDGPIPLGFRLESYGQAGAILRARIEPYADGAVRATRRLRERGRVRIALGVGAWGAAQRDSARLDLGPSATLALPIGGQQLRLALDWRQRVAGDARPGSGAALTIGSDF